MSKISGEWPSWIINSFVNAFNERSRNGHDKIHTGHLLFGIVHEEALPLTAERIIRKAGITSQVLHRALVELYGSFAPCQDQFSFDPDTDPRQVLKWALEDEKGLQIWSPCTRAAFMRSREIAYEHNHAELSNLHLLMAILTEDGTAKEILEYLGIGSLTSQLKTSLVLLPRMPSPRKEQPHEKITFVGVNTGEVLEKLKRWHECHPGYESLSHTLTVVLQRTTST